ncbi:MAG: hypothetical protein KJT01_03380 [Gemmatimonadetes bacterium]|nr:hypothetical protein [Gemmatimonadota bacterium]
MSPSLTWTPARVRWNPSLVLVTVQDGTHYTVMYDGAPMSAAIRTWLGMHRDDR